MTTLKQKKDEWERDLKTMTHWRLRNENMVGGIDFLEEHDQIIQALKEAVEIFKIMNPDTCGHANRASAWLKHWGFDD